MASEVITPLVSVVLSAAVSYYVAIFLKDREYKKEYYKKVIEKRMAAYQLVENVILELQYHKIANGLRFHCIYADHDSYVAFVNTLQPAVKSSMWLSVEVESRVSALNRFIYDVAMKYPKEVPGNLRKGGAESYDDIHRMQNLLKDFMRRDMYHLHDAERFFKSRR